MMARALLATFFTSPQAAAMRALPSDVFRVALWLLVNQESQATPYGVYRLNWRRAGKELGNEETLREGLALLAGLGFVHYDEESDFVWVSELPAMAYPLPLRLTDPKAVTARKWYSTTDDNPFLGPWFDRYRSDFHLLSEPFATARRGGRLVMEVHAGRRPGPEPVAGGDTAGPVGGNGAVLGRGRDGAGPCDIVQRHSNPVGTVGPQRHALLRRPAVGPGKAASAQVAQVAQVVVADEDFQLVPPDEAPAPFDKGRAFDELWALYPKASHHRLAQAAFYMLKPTAELFEEIKTALLWQRQSQDWVKDGGRYVPRMDRYFSFRRYRDRKPQGPTLNDRTTSTLSSGHRFIERQLQKKDTNGR